MDAPILAAAKRYDLVITGGETALRWRFDDHGVTLSHDGLAWTIGGRAIERTYSDIFSIRLQRNSTGKGPGIGNCRIAFRDGAVLTVHGGNDQGLADDAQAPLFAAFVDDLHERLAKRSDTRHISYQAGLTEGRYAVLTVAMVAAGLMFGLLPLALLIAIRSVETLALCGTAWFFLWPVYTIWQKNRPRSYPPGHPPEELLS